MISFSCQSCDQPYRVSDDKAGRRTTCARCRRPLTVPPAAEADRELVVEDLPMPPPVVAPNPALVACKDCRASVSRKAATCPHCGVANPGVRTGRVELVRSSGVTGATHVVRVAVDGSFVGEVRNGGVLAVDIPAGEHLLTVSGGGLSRELTVTVHDGVTARYEMYFSAWGALGGGLVLKPA